MRFSILFAKQREAIESSFKERDRHLDLLLFVGQRLAFLWRNGNQNRLILASKKNITSFTVEKCLLLLQHFSPFPLAFFSLGNLQTGPIQSTGIDCSCRIIHTYFVLFFFSHSYFQTCFYWVWDCATGSRDWTCKYYITKFINQWFNPNCSVELGCAITEKYRKQTICRHVLCNENYLSPYIR